MKIKALLLSLALLCALPLSASAQYVKQVLFSGNVSTTVSDAGTFTLPASTRYALLTYTTTNCASSCQHQVQIQMQDGEGTWIIFDAPAAETTNTTRRMLFSGTALNFGSNTTNILTLINKPFPTVFRLAIVRSGGAGNVDFAISLASW